MKPTPKRARCPVCRRELPDGPGAVCARCVLEDTFAHLEEADGRTLPGLALDDLPGVPGEEHGRVGKYELIEPVGGGGMGVVYRAWQPDLSRAVAVKTLPGGRFARPDFKERFRREAESAARLEHPNIVPVYDFGEHQGQPYLVMEYVSGRTLAAMAVELLAAPRQAAAVLRTIAEAVEFAHQRGVLHRDLKPSNVLVGLDGRPRITDFGLARPLVGGMSLTESGQLMGTPGYMAPEQVAGRVDEVGVRSDVYSLGALLYHLLTGRPPFVAGSLAEVIRLVQESAPMTPRELNPLVPGELERICIKCLEKSPGRRYATAGQLAADLARFLEDRPVEARPVPWVWRLVRWSRRNPVWAAGMAALAAVTLGAISFGLSMAKQTVNVLGERAIEVRREADRVEWQQYSRVIERTQAALSMNDAAEALRLLETTPARMRHWEYHHLRSRAMDEPRVWRALPGSTVPMTAVAASPDGRRVAGVGMGGILWVRDAETGRILAQNQVHQHMIHSVRYAPDGAWLITASGDGSAAIIEESSGEVRVRLVGPPAAVVAAAFIGSGDRCATAGQDGILRIWETASGTLLQERANGDPVEALTDLDVARGGDRVALAGGRGTVRVISTVDGAEEVRWLAHPAGTTKVRFSPDGSQVLTVGAEGMVKLWDAVTGGVLATLMGGTRRLTDVAWSPDGHRIAGASVDGTARVWAMPAARPESVLSGHQGAVSGVAFLEGHGRLVTSGLDRTLRRWSLQVQQGRSIHRPEEGVRSTCFDLGPGGAWFVRGDSSGGVTQQETYGWRVVRQFQAHERRVTCLALSPEGQRLVTGSLDGEIRLWRMGRNGPVAEVRGGEGTVRCLVFGPDGRWVASGADRGVAQLWDARSGELVRTFSDPSIRERRIVEVAFSPSGAYLVTADAGQQVLLWEAASGALLGSYSNEPRQVASMALSHDGRVAVGGREGVIELWRLQPIEWLVNLETHRALVGAVDFSPDNRRVVTGAQDGTLRLWEVETGTELLRLQTGFDAVRHLAFTPDGRSILSMGSDGTFCLWESSGDTEALREL